MEKITLFQFLNLRRNINGEYRSVNFSVKKEFVKFYSTGPDKGF